MKRKAWLGLLCLVLAGCREEKKPVAKVGDVVGTQPISWSISKCDWYSAIADRKPSATYLVVAAKVWNSGKKAVYIPQPYLIDGDGATYNHTILLLDQELSFLTELNPGVSRRGVIIFDVPQRTDYKIEVAGENFSNEKRCIKIE